MCTVIEGKMLTDIPLNGRNFLQLNLLAPGAIHSKNSNTFDAVQIDPTAQSFSVNGQKGDYNVYLLDGASIKEYQHGSNTFADTDPLSAPPPASRSYISTKRRCRPARVVHL